MKKKLSYRDKLLELAYIYSVKEIQDYTKRRKDLTTGQIELMRALWNRVRDGFRRYMKRGKLRN